ncbi:MAG: DUF624 domain-containing protein [Microbacteriaceae bacterium]|nr:DUF624 domain-containing protein [Microbacteriaceae bacterium]MCL2795548.1 DUF624 domain-containing protein [Microbacteriaceae bacterium]
MAQQATREFTSGPLYRVAEALYRVLGPTAGFLVACLPFAFALAAGRAAVIWAVVGIAIGPAWTALLYATRSVHEHPERGAFRAFWRGYRLNWLDTLKVWAPYWLLLVAAATDILMPSTPLVLRIVIGAVAAVSTVWMSAVLLIVSRYSFRTRDALRLGLYLLFAAPRSTFTNLALLLVAGGVIYSSSELLLGLLAGVFALFAVTAAKGAFELLDEGFTASSTPKTADTATDTAASSDAAQ